MNVDARLASDADVWPNEGLQRVPYWIFQRQDIHDGEQRLIFQGPCWHYLCLSVEVPTPGDYVTTFIGDAGVIVTRDADGNLYAFENRCAHRGTVIALEARGNTNAFTCPYHAWTYNRQGDLIGVAFKNGVRGKGGMPRDFRMQDHCPRKVRLAEAFGLVFGTFSAAAPDLENYLGPEIHSRIGRVLGGRTPVVLGQFTQALPNNWKLYIENVKDSYHASILHLFFTTFELNRLSQRGGLIIDASGGHHVSFAAVDRQAENTEYARQNIRSDSSYRLADPSLFDRFREFDDDVILQILSVFPTFVLQQTQNSIAARQIRPRGVEATDLVWTLIGFAEDTPEQRLIRLKQANLVGPAGYISMEDGCIGGFVQRGIKGAPDERAVLAMGGTGIESCDTRATEAAVRGFWNKYRALMGL